MAEFGSNALPNKRQEEFSQLRKDGLSLEASWMRTSPIPLGEETARNSGSRCARYPHVKARIEWLQKQAAKDRDDAALESETPIQWMQEICDIFRLTAESYDHLSMQKRSKLKRFYAAHLVRMKALEDTAKPSRTDSPDDAVWRSVNACTCQ